MKRHFLRLKDLIEGHRYGFLLFAFVTASMITGAGCVAFMRIFEFVLARRLDWWSIGPACLVTMPLLVLAAVELTRRMAPFAEGAGIPQTVFAAEHITPSNFQDLYPLTSQRTMVVKIVALLIAVWAGASTGREGPTVHVACCLFVGVLLAFRKFLGLKFDPRSAVIAGSAAGLAAAFNTPLAGVVFAVEELSTGYFGAVKDLAVMAIIVAATAARVITGEYAYFGRLSEPVAIPLTAVLVIGVLGGAAGAFFSTALVGGRRFFSRLEKISVGRYFWPAALACAVAGLALLGGPNTLGPGNKAAQELVSGSFGSWAYSFPFLKALATLCTYWAGVAGGIFAPCLAIGASLGASLATMAGLATAECAMVGMAAFLSGTIQAPITSFVIIFEMTGHHEMLLPIMLAAMVAFIVARILKARHLYHALAENYSVLLRDKPAPAGGH